MKNKGQHNADNITLNEAIAFLKDFASCFGIELKHLKLLPFEIAQMISLPYDAEETVRNTFCEQRKMFNNNHAGSPSKISGTPSNDYRLKWYDKYPEHPAYCTPNTLRMELQIKKMRVLNTKTFYEKYGSKIETMADLLEIKNWLMLRDLHLDRFRHVVIFDTYIKLPKNSKFKKTISDFSNPNYWEKLIKSCKTNKVYKDEYLKKVTLLRSLSKKYGVNIHFEIIQLLASQWIKFLNLVKETKFKVERFKADAPLSKKADAPFIACIPCIHFASNIYL